MIKQILAIGPNLDMKVHGGIVTHMKTLETLSINTDKFIIKFFSIGKKAYVGERLSKINIIVDFFKYLMILKNKDIAIVHINASMKNRSVLKNFLFY